MKRDYNRIEAFVLGRDPKDNAPAYMAVNCDMKTLHMVRQRYPCHELFCTYDEFGKLIHMYFKHAGSYREDIKYDDDGYPYYDYSKYDLILKDDGCYMTLKELEPGAQYIDTGIYVGDV